MIGTVILRNSRAIQATSWMHIYDVTDFNTLAKVGRYLIDLRVPIPVMISLSEITSNWIFSDTRLVTMFGYRLAIIASFSLSIWLNAESKVRAALSFGISLVFMYCTALIHPGNPQVYDVFFPLFFLLCIAFLQELAIRKVEGRKPVVLATLAGFTLSMAELSRPFFLLLLPLALLVAVRILLNYPRRVLVAFLIPVLLLSGLWNLNMLVRHQQFTWSNHSGFNLQRAWRVIAQYPPLLPEPGDTPLAPDRWENLNTSEHYANSRILQQAVADFVLIHPKTSLFFMATRIKTVLIDVATSIYTHKPESRVFAIYRPLVWLTASWLLIDALLLAWYLFTRGFTVLDFPINLLILLTGFTTLIVSIGEGGEEARFLISILPFLAVLPMAVATRRQDRQTNCKLLA
jgi:hypothetical protein